jgi:hypothetical protein
MIDCYAIAKFNQPSLKLKAGHPTQLHVGNQTRRIIDPTRLEHGLGRRKRVSVAKPSAFSSPNMASHSA